MNIENISCSPQDRAMWEFNTILRPQNFVIMIREIDATSIDQLRLLFAEQGQPKPSYTAIIMKAAAITLKKNPHANRIIFQYPFFKRLIQLQNIDISVAVDRSDPQKEQYAATQNLIIRDTLNKSLCEITSYLREVAGNPNHYSWKPFKKLTDSLPAWLGGRILKLSLKFPGSWIKHQGCACWVNSPARDGADLVMTTWPFPVSFSFGLVRERPIVVAGRVEVRRTIPLIMVFDRRIMGGGPASRVFAHFIDTLQHAVSTMAEHDISYKNAAITDE